MLSFIFENAVLIDGTGSSPFRADVGIERDRIVIIGSLRDVEAAQRIDASGKTIAPGFIDVHAHSDSLWLELPRCDGKIAQGVTTEIGGNCGTSAAPADGTKTPWRTLDDFFTNVERNGVALNVASLVGLGTTRRLVAGESQRKLDRDELAVLM